MRDILFVKTSSLGDVIHHMPAVTDARAAFPQARIGWMVEEAYVPLVRLHPAVDEVFPVAVRRWRRSLLSGDTWHEVGRALAAARGRTYDAIVDTQGLLRSAVLTRAMRGPRHGYDAASIRERPATLAYGVRHSVDRGLHAVERNRRLTALALGYEFSGPANYGIAERRRSHEVGPDAYAVLLHGSAQAGKEWPEPHWIAVGQALEAAGLRVVFPAGSAAEEGRARRLASALTRTAVVAHRPLDEVVKLIGGARAVVGLDTGLTHLAAAFGVPLVSIFAGSDPVLTGPQGQGPIAVLGSRNAPPAAAEVIAAATAVLLRAG